TNGRRAGGDQAIRSRSQEGSSGLAPSRRGFPARGAPRTSQTRSLIAAQTAATAERPRNAASRNRRALSKLAFRGRSASATVRTESAKTAATSAWALDFDIPDPPVI